MCSLKKPGGRALLKRAEVDLASTQRYIDLAGERFRDEADRLERRFWAGTGTKTRKAANPLG